MMGDLRDNPSILKGWTQMGLYGAVKPTVELSSHGLPCGL